MASTKKLGEVTSPGPWPKMSEDEKDDEFTGWTDGPARRNGHLFRGKLEDLNDSSSEEEEVEECDSLLGDGASLAMPEAETDVAIVALYKDRKRNPDKFEVHEALVSTLRKHGDREEQLRDARNTFHLLFPLPPQLWRQWVCDEAKALMGASKDASHEAVKQLCEDALQDYVDAPVWATYLELMTEVSPRGDEEESDVEDDVEEEEEEEENESSIDTFLEVSRGHFQKAIAAVGAHYSFGKRIWRMYRSFERRAWCQAKRKKLPQSKISTLAERVFNTYRDQLAMPLKGNEVTVESMNRFVSLVGQENFRRQAIDVVDSHRHCLDLRLQCEAHEAAVIAAARRLHNFEGSSRLELNARHQDHEEAWLAYCGWLIQRQNISLVLCVFERAVAACRGIGATLWHRYCNFVSQHLKDIQLTLRVSRRAVRNCPQNVEFHLLHMRALERDGAEASVVDTARVRALRSPLSGGADARRAVLLSYCDFCRRRLQKSWSCLEPVAEDCINYIQLLRDGFKIGLAFLERTYPKWFQGRFLLHKYYASVEENLIGDISGEDSGVTNARHVWNSCIDDIGRFDINPWLSFAEFEHRQNKIDAERAIFQKAFQTILLENSGLSTLIEAWLHMERERGTIDDFEHALVRVSAVREEQEKYFADMSRDKGGTLKRSVSHTDCVSSDRVAKRMRSRHADEAKSKQSRTTEIVWPKHPLTIYVKGFSTEETDDFLKNFFSACGTITAARVLLDKRTKLPRGEGLVQFESIAGVENALKLNNHDGVLVERSRFPALNTDSTPSRKNIQDSANYARNKSKNPYLNTAKGNTEKQITRELQHTKKTPMKPKSSFSFMPRSLRQTSTTGK